MTNKERLRAAGLRRAQRLVAAIGTEVRELRMMTGISQARLADAAGVSRWFIGELELRRLRRLDLARLSVIYALLGHDLSCKAFPAGEPLRDAAHLRLLERLAPRIHPSWRRTREAVMPIQGDLRAWDLRLDGPASVGVEAETNLRDRQALERRISAKQRDSGVDFVVLLVADTHRNREVLRSQRASLRQQFPLNTRETLEALAAGHSPGGSGIVVL